MKGTYLALALSLFSCSALAAERVIHFGTSATYPPFEFVDGNNQVAGFDIDIARAVCKELQATCNFTNQSFDSLIPALRFKKMDAVIAGWISHRCVKSRLISRRRTSTNCRQLRWCAKIPSILLPI